MKFLEMYSAMENAQMKLGFDKPYVETGKIYSYIVKEDVRNRKNDYMGYSIVCKSAGDGIHYLCPPIDNTELVRATIGGTPEIKAEMTKKLNDINSSVRNFIPDLLTFIRLAKDGSIIKVVIKDGKWEPELV